MTKKQATTICILTIIALFAALLVSRRVWFRLDLTKNKSYTISAVSRNLHNEISDQVRITYYRSDKLKTMSPVPGEIEDLLREYVAYSRGKIRLSVKDPTKVNLSQQQMEQIGVIPRQIRTLEQDQSSLITVYTGITMEYLDKVDVLPVVFSMETLEYDLTSRIRAMIHGTSRQLGVIVGGSPRQWNEEYRPLQIAFAYAGYDFRVLSPGENIPDTIPALFVLGGVETLDEAALYQIDRYIQAGGKALFTAKSVNINKEGNLEAKLAHDNGLLSMLSLYGVTVLPEMAMDRSALTMQYQTGSSSGIVQLRFVQNPQWIRVLEQNGNPNHPVSSRFSGLDLFWASPLSLSVQEGVQADYLFTGTAEGWSMREPFYTNPEVSSLFERDAASTRGKKILGASLTGIFPSYFSDKPKPQAEDDSEFADMPAEAKPARVIVIGETDFATSIMNVTGGQQNTEFLIQVADWLCNDDDIIGIRNRTTGSGRLDKIIQPGKKAAAIRTAQIINVFFMPFLVVLAGVILALTRRAKAQSRAGAVGGAGASAGGGGGDKNDNTKESSDDV